MRSAPIHPDHFVAARHQREWTKLFRHEWAVQLPDDLQRGADHAGFVRWAAVLNVVLVAVFDVGHDDFGHRGTFLSGDRARGLLETSFPLVDEFVIGFATGA